VPHLIALVCLLARRIRPSKNPYVAPLAAHADRGSTTGQPSTRRTPRIRPYALAALERNHRRLTGARAFAGSLQLGGAHPRGRGVLAGVGR